MSEVKDKQEQPKVEIAVENFGPIAEANIDLRPLTIFVGPSNTGKTYFATLVYALYGVFPNMTEPRILFPSGHQAIIGFLYALQNIVLTDKNPSVKKKAQELLKKLNTSDRAFRISDIPMDLREILKSLIDDAEVFGDKLQSELKNCFDLDVISELRRLTKEEQSEMIISLKVNEAQKNGWRILLNASESDVVLNSSYNDTTVLLPEGLAISTNWKGNGNFDYTFSGNWDVELTEHGLAVEQTSGENRYYLPAARSGIMHSHRILASSLVKRTTKVGLESLPEVPTLSGPIADSMQKIILYREKKKQNDEMKNIAESLENQVLFGQIRYKPTSSGYPDFRYIPQGTHEEIRISQSSSMVSELAPLVLLLRSGINPGDTLIIEEPEAHLHPSAQADMAVILARLVRAGVKVIITTHSDWLLQEIGNLIRAGELEKFGEEVDELPTFLDIEQVGIWHFQKNGEVEEIPYNRIDGVEPMEYLDVAEDLYNRSARLQNRLEELKGNIKRESE